MKVGDRVPNHQLRGPAGSPVFMWDLTQLRPVMLVFYPGDFTPICTKQLCSYQARYEDFQGFGLEIVGISANEEAEHEAFTKKHGFTFPLLTDPGKKVTKAFGVTSVFMLMAASRANVILSKNDGNGPVVLYHHVEPLALTFRKSDTLLEELRKLKAAGKI